MNYLAVAQRESASEQPLYHYTQEDLWGDARIVFEYLTFQFHAKRCGASVESTEVRESASKVLDSV